jgi:tetratricopeptide (TPR) repeat protein
MKLTNKFDPFSPSMLTNPLVLPVTPALAGGYSCLGALLSFVYLSVHWTMAASVFYSFVMLGLRRDRKFADSRTQARTINQLAALTWEKIQDGLEVDALEELKELYQHTPTHPLVQFYLSRALVGIDPAQGRKVMLGYIHEMRLKDERCDLRAYVTLGQHCAHLGNGAEADWVWREGQRLCKEDSMRAYFVLSRALLFAAEYPQQALDILQSVQFNNPLEPHLQCDMHYWKGCCFSALGENAGAMREFQALVAISPDYEDAAERLADLQQEPVTA